MSYEKFKSFSQRSLLYTYSARGGAVSASPPPLDTPLPFVLNQALSSNLLVSRIFGENFEKMSPGAGRTLVKKLQHNFIHQWFTNSLIGAQHWE